MNDHLNATTHSSGTPAVLTLKDIERIEKTISSAPVPARPLTTADALVSLAPAMSKARDRGHTLASLVQLCEAQGLHVSERQLSRAISTARASKPARKKPASGAPSAT
ncbi:MAG: hypothetical protein CK604_07170 [Curvibacter sp. PD_MW3]|nr:MAG: hypothetical protein CK604_07170 [Curvibacter sp. PD_MW3]